MAFTSLQLHEVTLGLPSRSTFLFCSKQLEENVHTKVLISQLEKKVDKLEKELDSVRGK